MIDGDLTADAITHGTLTIGAGATVTIAPLSGGPLASSENLFSVPEPNAFAMLLIATSGLIGVYFMRK